MAEQLDVYRDWLGIKETARPLNYYQLLRVKQFEDSTAKIREHYRKMNGHVRKYATGDYAEQSQELLNELAKAMLCLTDNQRKREYDASLGRKVEAEGRRRTFEEVLLGDKVIDREQLDRARRFADAVNLDLRDAVLQQKMADPDVVLLAYAESEGLPYIDLDDVGIDESLVPRIPPATARQQSCVPVMIDNDQLLVASPRPLVPDIEEDLRLRFEMPVRTVLCTPAKINEAVAKYYPRDATYIPPAATTKGQKEKKKKTAKPAREKKPRDRDEKIKRSAMLALIGFNITVVLIMVLLALLGSDMGYFGRAVLAVGLGLVVGAITFAAVFKLNL
jgi:hypothetical protein